MYQGAMNVFDQLLSRLATSMRSDSQVSAVMDVVFEAKGALDRAFGPGNRRSASLTRLMLRLNQPVERRQRVDTVYRVAELLAASSNDLRRHQGKPVNTRGMEFFDSLPQAEALDVQEAPDTAT
jgi:KaiC/GvpD/RAD55 family RecA-like ATPase